MDIEFELNQLVFKYNIDKRFPAYRKYVKAYDILKYYYEQLLLEKTPIVLISENETDLNWVKSCVCSREEKHILCSLPNIPESELEKDTLYINLSYCHRDEINILLLERDLQVVSIYNMFEEEELYFQNAFYDVYAEEYMPLIENEFQRDFEHFDINLYFFRHRRLYELSKDINEKQLYLEKMIFDCIMAKDFLMMKKYIGFMQTNEKERYVTFYQEIERLFDKMKQEMHSVKKNVLIFWLDAVEYNEIYEMEYLQEVEKTSVSFRNAYTVTPYTSATFKTFLTAKRAVEEEAYQLNEVKEKDSVLIQGLRKNGFDFRYYGFLKCMENTIQANAFYTYFTPITQLYWDLIRDMLLKKHSSENVCVLHEILQTHHPFVSFGLTGTEYNGKQAWRGQQVKISNNKRQQRESRKYVDEQLRFYGDLLPKEMTKIYLSDHGHTKFGRFHTFLMIQNELLEPRQIDELFSYKDFYKLLLDIACRNQIQETYLSEDYVLIQDVDYYSDTYINACVEECDFDPEMMFGYQGVVTPKDMLLKHNNGFIFYYKHKNDENMVTDERLEYLETLLSKKRIDVQSEEKFKATRKIYRAWEKSSHRYEKEEVIKKQIIREFFENMKEDTVLAIRGGGIETIHLLLLLPYKLRRKVKYIIDYNMNCAAGHMGVKVILPEEIENYKIDKILLSSFEYKEIWKNELLDLSIDLIDLYEEFKNAGIICTNAFYKRQYMPEDFI